MSALLRLYPRAWRERYGDELIALLEARPPSFGDRLDVIRGALDARLHPQVPGVDAGPEKEIPVLQRRLGLAAAGGGIVWILAIASMLVLPRDIYGDPNTSLAGIGLAIASCLIGVALGELGTRYGSAGSARTGHAVAYVSFFVGITLALPWPYFIIGLCGFPILGWLAALRGTLNGAFPTWFVAIFGIAALATLAGFFGLANSEIGPILLVLLGFSGLVLAGLAFSARPTNPPTIGTA
jgi:hypothetical protein